VQKLQLVKIENNKILFYLILDRTYIDAIDKLEAYTGRSWIFNVLNNSM